MLIFWTHFLLKDKKKHLLPYGSKSFPLKVVPTSEGAQIQREINQSSSFKLFPFREREKERDRYREKEREKQRESG